MDGLKRDVTNILNLKSPPKIGPGMWGKVSALLLGLILGFWCFNDSKLDTLNGKRVLVTGASTGIGEQLAYQYAKLGCHVAVTSRRKEALLKVTKRCQKLSPQNFTHHAVVGDMLVLESTKTVVDEAVSLLGGLDILVLNHITPQDIMSFTGSPENITLFSRVMDINFRSYVHLTSHALPQLIANDGSIVVVNSLLGKVNHPYLASYSASKHALHGFFGSLRSQFVASSQDVSVTLCSLGLIGTENAIQQLKESGSTRTLQLVPPALPEDTALAIVTANARRETEMYFPYWTVRPLIFLKGFFPQIVDAIMRATAQK